ncbi:MULTISPECIES: BTAD domain-containing putative transcriptional regulator [unclassified Streptomyces]|uniref:AfsR/SARP family transcriptional regulator n=1 Tax=unclassified Streptomyces TaxID=2593676 RepID=UPI002DDABE2D|nr:BTAD domain-containing putative transcriptional regulator [Streptomyces sp. NBC_01795]WSA94742.1 tetratricopeptide repeat protein [Streptomyces sp. NBC_01795]WSS41422.1 tetratricopeptide repeat protein [Streptomyces sp. NBC_01187]
MKAEYTVLGDIGLRVDGRPVGLGHLRQRTVLAVLLVEDGRAVTADQLAERVWGEPLPGSFRSTLYGYISRLRGLLAATGAGGIVKGQGGYRLQAVDAGTDLRRFRQLAAQARDTPDQKAADRLFTRALEVWAGDFCAGVDTPWFNELRGHLAQERFAVELDRNDVALHHGRHRELLPELTDRADRYELDQRLAGQLILALHRCGRTADALHRYEYLSGRLAEELGMDPGGPLRRLRQQLLSCDPALDPAPSASAATGTAQAPVPHQLPAPPRPFTGRRRELAELTDRLAGSEGGHLLTIGGPGGVGKTWLALHWAHTHSDGFPDGQLYADLHGYDPSVEPVDPAAVIRNILHAFGVAPESVPPDPAARSALYRSVLAGRRLIVVLDNARDENQVRPLLPGSPSSTVLVTSRNRLTALAATHGSRELPLDVFGETEARTLLTLRLGAERAAAEDGAVTTMLEHCGGLPLALSIIAARAAARPDFPLEVHADELRETTGRLDVLDAGDLTADLRAVFSSSVRALSPPARDLFALLGPAPGPDIGLPAVACLTASPASRARVTLRELVTAHLVYEDKPGRYRMHDLLRLYAAEQAAERGERTVEPPGGQEADAGPLRRLVDFYLHSAHAAERLLHPHRTPLEIGEPTAGCAPDVPADEVSAFTWLENNHPHLLAAQRLAAREGRHAVVWHLAWSLDTYHRRRGHVHSQLLTWRAGRAAAAQLADPAAQALACRCLGIACIRAGLHEEALEHLHEALRRAKETGDVAGQAHSRLILAYAWESRGNDEQALRHAGPALPLFEALAVQVWTAQAHTQVGLYCARLGQYGRARTHCRTALALFRHQDERDGMADAESTLGYIAHHEGRPGRARHHYEQALRLFQELGHAYREAETLDRLGDVLSSLGREEEAQSAWSEALTLYRAQHREQEAQAVTEHLHRS